MSRLEQFSAGERFAVDPDAIERELAAIWREAGTTARTGDARPVTRACLWNVIVHLEERQGRDNYVAAERWEQAISQLAAHLASRTLVVRTRPAKPKEPELESWISANCVIAGGGGKLVCSEEITLASRGTGDRHLAGLVRALLVPGIPTAVFMADAPDMQDKLQHDLVDIADRIVTDLDELNRPHVDRFASIRSKMKLGAMDLSWLRLADLRREVAELFEGKGLKVNEVTQVNLRGPQRSTAGRQWMAQWLAASLGAQGMVATEKGWELTGSDVEMTHQEGDDWGIEIVTASQTCTVARQKRQLTVDLGPAQNKRPQRKDSDAFLMAQSLIRRQHDTPLIHALSLSPEAA